MDSTICHKLFELQNLGDSRQIIRHLLVALMYRFIKMNEIQSKGVKHF